MGRNRFEGSPQSTTVEIESLKSGSLQGAKGTGSGNSKVLRFNRSERLVHWAIAVPFLVCFATALVLFIHYNPDPQRPYRALFSWTHRISGICLIVFPMLAIYKSKGDLRIHFYNIKQAWVWTLADVKWLALMGLAAVSNRVQLPEQGKFNAAEKINFMTLMGTYPLYIITGLTIWITDGAFLSWIVHTMMAIIATPLLLGHIFMATINPSSRKGLEGMISGYVDRQWAKHHYGGWYREQVEQTAESSESNQLAQIKTPEKSQDQMPSNEPPAQDEKEKINQICSLIEEDSTSPSDEAAESFSGETAIAHNEPPGTTENRQNPDIEKSPAYPADISPRKLANLVLLHFALGINYEDTGRYIEAGKQYETVLEIGAGHNLDMEEVEEARIKLESLRIYAKNP